MKYVTLRRRGPGGGSKIFQILRTCDANHDESGTVIVGRYQNWDVPICLFLSTR